MFLPSLRSSLRCNSPALKNLKIPTTKLTQRCFTSTKDMNPETTSLSLGYHPREMSFKSIKPPLHLSSTFVFDNAATGADAFAQVYGLNGKHATRDTPYIYSRVNNPNLCLYEQRLAAWDKMEHCLLFSSGMAAISTLFHSLLKPSDHMIISEPVYGGTHAFAEHILPMYNINAHFINAGDNASNEIENIINNHITDINKLKLILIETPSNPSIQHTNISKISEITKYINNNKKTTQNNENKCFLAVDNTFLGPVFQTPSQYGADATLYSATKFLGGHSDLIAGAISCENEYLYDQLTLYRTLMGSMSQPFIAWLLLRSLETLSIRMNQACKNAIELAKLLQSHPNVTNLRYPLLLDENSLQYQTYLKQCKGSGSLIVFDVVGTQEDAYKVLDSLEIFSLAVSLGGTESLVEHPQSMTHSDCNAEQLKKQGVNECTIRMSVGIEHIDDLKHDVQQALDRITPQK